MVVCRKVPPPSIQYITLEGAYQGFPAWFRAIYNERPHHIPQLLEPCPFTASAFDGQQSSGTHCSVRKSKEGGDANGTGCARGTPRCEGFGWIKHNIDPSYAIAIGTVKYGQHGLLS